MCGAPIPPRGCIGSTAVVFDLVVCAVLEVSTLVLLCWSAWEEVEAMVTVSVVATLLELEVWGDGGSNECVSELSDVVVVSMIGP